MKTDIEKIEKITSEMALNDIAYLIMQDELDALKADIDCGDYDDFEEEMRRAYFYQRVLSILANEDIPMRATIGLLSTDGILCELYGDRYGFIGESDTDEDIYKYVMEYGYRMYDRVSFLGDTPEEVFIILSKKYIANCTEGDFEDDDE
mgnify:CR=1 FL=1